MKGVCVYEGKRVSIRRGKKCSWLMYVCRKCGCATREDVLHV